MRKQEKLKTYVLMQHREHQQITQHFQPLSASSCTTPLPLFLLLCLPSLMEPCAGTPSLMIILARVAASKTSSTPSIFNAEHSLYARAPIARATFSPISRVTQGHGFSGVFRCGVSGRRSDLHPTRITGIVGPHIERTSSIHCDRNQHKHEEAECYSSCLRCYVVKRVQCVKGEGNEDYMRF